MMIYENKELPNKWKWVKLGDICEVTKLAGFEYTEHVTYCSNGEYIALRAQNVRNDGLDLQNIVYISKETASFLSRSKLSFGDVVMTFIGANIGESTWIDKNDTYYCAPNIAKITPNKELLYYQFLTRVIHSPIIRQQIEELNKSTAQQSLSMQNIREFFIPIPPLAEQKRIAAVLEKCDRLRRTRRYALQLSETLLQSVFLEMFGNLETNSKGWKLIPFDDVCSIDAEMVDPKLPEFRKLLHIGAANIESITGHILNLQTAEQERLISSKFLINPKHILFSKIRPKLRKVAFPQIHGLCSADVYPIRIKSSCCNQYFLLYFLRSNYFSNLVSELAESRTNIPKINREELSEQSIPVPPLPLQEKFAQIVQKFERFRTQQREAERQAEHLFQTLLHRAFRGELTSDNLDEKINSSLTTQTKLESQTPTTTAEKLHQSTTKTAPSQPTQHPDTEIIQLTLPGLD